jgi:hypothetical protein
MSDDAWVPRRSPGTPPHARVQVVEKMCWMESG